MTGAGWAAKLESEGDDILPAHPATFPHATRGTLAGRLAFP